MSRKRKICVVVTARPSYSRIKSALSAIEDHPDLELQLVATASALLERYGSAHAVMCSDGFTIAEKVYSVVEGDALQTMANTTGFGIQQLAGCFSRLKPDAVVTIADRFETMATAIAASYMNIPLVHIQGGEVTGSIDEKVRHAITKLSDLHFVSSQNAKERVIKMGEEPQAVFNTGCPSIDLAVPVLEETKLNFTPFERYGGVGPNFSLDLGYIVVMQHPVTTEHQRARAQCQETLEAARAQTLPVFWFWPNVDAGSDGSSKAIRVFREKYPSLPFHFFKNMEPKDFLSLIFHAKALVGNSSVGIREAAFLGIPVVNVGSRQNGRARGENVMDVAHQRQDIENAILSQSQRPRYASQNIYGKGDAGKQIANLLAEQPLRFTKALTY